MGPRVASCQQMENMVGRRSVVVYRNCGEEENSSESLSSSSSEKEAKFITPQPVNIYNSPSQSSPMVYSNSEQHHVLNYTVLPDNELPIYKTNYISGDIPLRMTELHSTAANMKKKTPQPFPEECKDELYWERRKRNNESAKKSRALRKLKEQQTSIKVVYLEQENLRLKTEVAMLKQELDKMQKLLYAKSSMDS